MEPLPSSPAAPSSQLSTPSSAASLKIYWRLLGYLKPLLGMFGVSLIGYLIFASSQPMLAGILKYFVDGLGSTKDTQYHLPILGSIELMYGIPILMVLIIVWRSIGSFLGNYYLARVSLGLVEELRIRLFESMLRLPNTYFDNNNSGHLISRITYNVTMVTGAATDAIKVVIREGLTVAALFGYLLWMNWKLTSIMLAILPVIGLMVSGANRKFRKQSKKIQASMGDLTHITSEAIQGYRVVRSFGGEAYENRRFRDASADNTLRQLRMVKTGSTFTPALQLVTFSAMAAVLFLVLYLRGDATAGDLIAYITAAGLLPKPIRQLSEVSSTIQKGLAGAESIFAQLDEAPEVDEGKIEKPRVQGKVEFRNLSFCYPGSERPVLHNINLTIAPGQMVAIVGRSGSGKSTLANLLPRFYPYQDGQIFIDDVEIREYTLTNLRRHMALVTQHVALFNDTVRANIAYGDLADAPHDAIAQAAEDACAHEFIEKLPEGFDTRVGESGVLLSGGQRQRLAIARALLKDAPILILDEATSALDTETERHIRAALDKVMEGRTTLVIAHRLSTIERADLILVMEDGKIVERGTHAELIAAQGAYAQLHAVQLGESGETLEEGDGSTTPDAASDPG